MLSVLSTYNSVTVPQALHEKILYGKTGCVLEAITNAESLLGRQQIDFPRIAVFGDEGTGKSSTLEAIFRIEADDSVDLTLVDLPGYFTHETLEGEDSGAIQLVEESLLSFLKDENTIVLVVVPANQLVKTVNIFNLLKKNEKVLSVAEKVKFRARTVYCFTKCDLVAGDPGTTHGASYDIGEILCNRGAFAAEPHGWYAVVNNGGSSLPKDDFTTRLSLNRVFEDSFFNVTSPYNKSDLRYRCGTDNVVQKLSSILAEKISEKAPKILAKTKIALGRANRELKQLGAPPPEGRDINNECRTIVNDIKALYVNATEGIYGDLKDEVEDLAEQFSQDDLDKCELAYQKKLRCETFAAEIRASRVPLNDAKYLDELRQTFERVVDGKLDYTMPIPEVVFEEVRKCAKKWRALGEALCNGVADAAIECLNVLVQVKSSRYENLPSWLNKHFKNMIEEQRTKALTRLDWHYVDEIMRPDTLNVLFKKEIDAMRDSPVLGKNRDGNRDAYVNNLRAYLPIAEARYIDNSVRTVTTHILDVPGGKRRSRVASDVAPIYTFQTLEISDVEGREGLMKLRDDFSEERSIQTAKVKVLDELREALRAMPAATSVTLRINGGETDDGYGNAANIGTWVSTDGSADEDGIAGNTGTRASTNGSAPDEEKPSLNFHPPERDSFMQRIVQLGGRRG